MKTNYFAIQQKGTGFFFPITGRGSTHAEFHKNNVPRLFSNHHSARFCLEWWISGRVTCTRRGGRNEWTGEWDYHEDLDIEKVPSRIKDHYEIVSIDFQVKG